MLLDVLAEKWLDSVPLGQREGTGRAPERLA